MNKLILLAALVFCGNARAEQAVTIKIQPGAESLILFNSLSVPKIQGVDEAGAPVLIRRYSTTDNAVQISCEKNPLSGNASCSTEFNLEQVEEASTQVVIAPTGAIIATLSGSESAKLSSVLAQPKVYRSQEKVTVNFNGKIFQAPRLTIDCALASSNTAPKTCQVIAFQ